MVTQKAKEIDQDGRPLWQAIQTSKGVKSISMYRWETGPDGKRTNEIIEMHLPSDGQSIVKYLARGFVLDKKQLTGEKPMGDAPTIKVYACDEPGCDRDFPAKGALALHKQIHKRNKNQLKSE